MLKNLFKKNSARLLVVVVFIIPILVSGFELALAGRNPENLSGHPGLVNEDGEDILGSITIHLRAGTNDPDVDPTTGGLPTMNVPISIQQVVLNDPNTVPQANDFHDLEWISNNTTPVNGEHALQNLLTDANGTASFPDLPQGIWLVRQLDELNGVVNPISEASRFADFLVGIPTYVPSAQGAGTFLLDIEVWPKFEQDRLQGTTHEVISSYDNFITWEYGMNIPSKIASTQNLYALTFFDARLRLDPSNVIGRFTTASGNEEALASTHFSVTQRFLSDAAYAPRQLFQISLTESGIAHIAEHGLLVDGRIYFTLTTPVIIQSEADLGDISSEIVLRLNVDEVFDIVERPDFNPYALDGNYWENIDGEKIIASTTTYALDVLALNVSSREGLAGSTFELYRQVSEEIVGETTAVTVDDVVYHMLPLRDMHGNPLTSTTDANGQVRFLGVASRIVAEQSVALWLHNSEITDGYRAIEEWMPVHVTMANVGDRDENNTIIVGGDHFIVPVNVYADLANGWILPETGGMGTVLLTIIGVGFISVTLFLFTNNKEKEDAAS